MPEIYSFEKPPKQKMEELLAKLKEVEKIRPRLTFPFPLNEKRREALEMISTGRIKENKLKELLESNDFVEKRAGLYLLTNPNLPKEKIQCFLPYIEIFIHDSDEHVRFAAFESLKKLGEKAPSLFEKLVKEKDEYIRVEASNSLGNVAKLSKDALPFLVELIENKYVDAHVKKNAIVALGKIGREALPLLEKLSEDELFRPEVAKALGNVGEEALPLLGKLSKDESEYVRAKVAEALGNLGQRALPLLEKLSEDEREFVRTKVAQALGKMGKMALPILEKLSKDKDLNVRNTAIEALGDLGEEALPLFKKLSGDKDPLVRHMVARALRKLGEKSIPLLEKLSKDTHPGVRECARQSIKIIEFAKKGGYKYLLPTKKPLFATPYTEELAMRIKKIEKIARELEKKYKEDFIGIVVFGGTSKGYFTEESDVDLGVIGKDPRLLGEVYEMVKKEFFKPCHVLYVEVMKEEVWGDREILFLGQFFGDYEKLKELQEKTLANMEAREWDNIRKTIMKSETDLLKAAYRFNIPPEEMEKITQIVALLRVPLSYEETMKIVKRRAK